jgi:transposase
LKEGIQWEDIMPKEQRTFTREFKLEAVQLVQKSRKSQAQIARDLGIADSTLHHWCKEFAEAGSQAFPGSGHQTAQEEELRRLKREWEARSKLAMLPIKAMSVAAASDPMPGIDVRILPSRQFSTI